MNAVQWWWCDDDDDAVDVFKSKVHAWTLLFAISLPPITLSGVLIPYAECYIISLFYAKGNLNKYDEKQMEKTMYFWKWKGLLLLLNSEILQFSKLYVFVYETIQIHQNVISYSYMIVHRFHLTPHPSVESKILCWSLKQKLQRYY